MKKKKILGIVIVGVICCIVFLMIFILTRKQSINYEKLVDEECGFEISQYLELGEASFKNEDVYELQFKIKQGCEAEIEKILEVRYYDALQNDSNLYMRNSSMKQLIESGQVRHIYRFFREGKVKNASGERVLSIEIRICIVDIDGKSYAFIYTANYDLFINKWHTH